jgi:hypothetical protein
MLFHCEKNAVDRGGHPVAVDSRPGIAGGDHGWREPICFIDDSAGHARISPSQDLVTRGFFGGFDRRRLVDAPVLEKIISRLDQRHALLGVLHSGWWWALWYSPEAEISAAVSALQVGHNRRINWMAGRGYGVRTGADPAAPAGYWLWLRRWVFPRRGVDRTATAVGETVLDWVTGSWHDTRPCDAIRRRHPLVVSVASSLRRNTQNPIGRESTS